MKKQLLIIVAVVLLFVSCGKTDTPDTEVNTQQMETENTTQMESLEETTEAVSEATTEVSTEIESEVTTESETETQSESEEAQTPTYTYTDMDKTMYAKSSVNVRDLPSTDGNKLGGLSKAQEVHVTGQCNETGWYRINYNGGTGYVSSNYLADEKPVEETPTQPSEPSTPSNPGECPVTMYQLFDEGDYIYCYVDSFHLLNPTTEEITKRDTVISEGNYLALTRWNGSVNHYICREEFMWGDRTVCLVEWLPK